MLNHRALSLVLLLLTSLGVLLPARDAAALCAMPSLSGHFITPLDLPVPRGGSLLLALGFSYVRGEVPVTSDSGGVLRVGPAALVQGSTRIALRPTYLPGGLVRLDFEHPPANGTYTLEGLSQSDVTPPTVTIGGVLPAAPTDPGLTRVTYAEREDVHEGPRGRVRSLRTVTRVSLARPVSTPNGLLLLQLVAGGAVQIIDAALDSTELTSEDTLGGRCGSPSVPGRGQVAVGSEVRAIMVDVYGRTSAPGSAVRVGRGRALAAGE